MKLHELAEQCAVTLSRRAKLEIDQYGYVALFVPPGNRLPFRAELSCEHADGTRVYHVRIHQIFQYLARATKPAGSGG